MRSFARRRLDLGAHDRAVASITGTVAVELRRVGRRLPRHNATILAASVTEPPPRSAAGRFRRTGGIGGLDDVVPRRMRADFRMHAGEAVAEGPAHVVDHAGFARQGAARQQKHARSAALFDRFLQRLGKGPAVDDASIAGNR
jgi:hypothetical protein